MNRCTNGVSVRWRRLGVKHPAGLVLAAGLLTILASGCTSAPSSPRLHVTLAGAQVPLELVQSWLDDARDYSFRTERRMPMYLSQHGFERLAKGECDIACTDRMISPNELGDFGDKPPRGYRVAFYGFGLYVNQDNPLDSIFARHLTYIFQRRFTDWKQVAAEPVPRLEGPINLYGPQKATRGGMILARQARIWFDEPTWEALDSDAEIIDHVAADPKALGFASIGYDGDVRYLGLRMRRTGPPAFPSLEEIESGRYGLAKVIYIYVSADATPETDAVIEHLYSSAGAAAIESTDVWPIPRERAAVPRVR